MGTGPRAQVLVTGRTGRPVTRVREVPGSAAPIPAHVPLKPGETPAVIVDVSAARALGSAPEHDLNSGIATVWPEFAQAAAEGSTAL